MNIAVAIRLMPKVGDELDVDESGTDIDRELVEMVINEFDDQALEEAVLIKEATGATVTAVGLRADGIEEALRLAYARGADRLVVVEAGEIDPYDSRTGALAFAEAFRQLAPDLVLTGVQTPSDVFGQTAPYLAATLGWPQANVVVGVTLADGTARVVQEYAGGRLAVLGLQLPAVVGVQSASSPPRYVAMARLRQAMTEASAETLNVSVEAPAAAPKLTSLARPAPQAQATMIEGDAEEAAAQIVGGAARTWGSGGLMGDVLVYVESPVNDRLLAFARPLADAAGGELVALVASGEPTGEEGLAAADVVLEVSHPALSPYLPEAHQAVLAAAIRRAHAGPRRAREHHGRLGPRGRGRGGGRPALRGLLRRADAPGRGGGGGQRNLRGAAPRDRAHAAARRCSRSTPRPCTKSRRLPGGANASSSRRRPSWRA